MIIGSHCEISRFIMAHALVVYNYVFFLDYLLNQFSISVKLKLLSLNEEYVFSMPSAYARSILTVPWAEMGDKINLTCQKTNMSSTVTFHTKVNKNKRLNSMVCQDKTHKSTYFV